MTREQINVWRPEDAPGIELRSGFAVTAPYPRHWHEEYQLCLIQSGGGELFYRGAHHDTPSASLFVVHPGEVHSNRTEVGCSFRSLYIAPELIRRTCSEVAGRPAAGLPFFPAPLIYDPEVIRPYLSVFSSWETAGTTLKRESSLTETLALLVGRHAEERAAMRPPGREHAAVGRAREYLAEHYARNVSLSELARVANLSPFHLTRVFTREVGMPPHAFQTQVRVARAKRLIRAGLPLSDVAAATGFADQSHFIRHFKRLMKVTPGAYSKKSKNVQDAAPARR